MIAHNFNVGDIVEPTAASGFWLRSGASLYNEAVVISVDPFKLCSIESDMLWTSTIKPEYFKHVGVASEDILKNCLRRLKD